MWRVLEDDERFGHGDLCWLGIPAVVCTTLILFAFLINGPYIIALVGGMRAAPTAISHARRPNGTGGGGSGGCFIYD